MDIKIVARNRKASFEYFLLEKFEAGIALTGSEIKSIRNGQISLSEAYIRIENGEAWLLDAHISPYFQSGINNHDPLRKRKLLLHKREIRQLWDEVRKKGVTIIPVVVFLKRGKAKIEIALAKGKKNYDKRAIIAKRDSLREIDRQLRQR